MNPLNIYGDIFAEVYNLYWTEFLDVIAPQLITLYRGLDSAGIVLDLCCGTGRLSSHFLKKDIEVIGIDLSPDMIAIANRKNITPIEEGKAHFEVGNAITFEVDETVSMVVSTFDSLNHLQSMKELRACFDQVYKALKPGGIFVFDLNSEKGLKKWEFVDFEDHDDTIFIMHGKYNRKEKKAYTRVNGFTLDESTGQYRRFDETMSNTVFDFKEVQNQLIEAGFGGIRITQEMNPLIDVETPEAEDRVFFIGQRAE